ncbi:MinD/ParA family protein [Salipaludibacillus daqingensis]|uniref:MinD/ParA family protein n=1 Tax=Salipaludibacillus daqingensis TaxID=3041001 RepID=UPI0024739386|nr:MinD/ParA family protein [Salipaludibacillus daqingensis]
MNDQADALRNKMTSAKSSSAKRDKMDTKIISVVSGKGGVGKSNFVVNFSLALQRNHKRVLIIDLDIGMANIDILLGQSSSYSIVDMIEREMSIWSVIEKGPLGLSYIAGGSGLSQIFEMNREKANFFYRQIESLENEFDYIFFDMGAGVTNSSFHFLLSSHEVFLITTPEPTSVTDAYGMIKYIDLKDRNLPISMIVNRAHSKKDGEHTSQNVLNVAKRFLNKQIHLLATLPDDEIVWKAVRAQQPFILYSPKSKPANAIEKAVKNYLNEADTPLYNEKTIHSFISKLKGFIRQ